MRLAAIHPGDIVRGGGMHALVIEKRRGALIVQGICNRSTRRLRADEIDGHWRRARVSARTQTAVAANANTPGRAREGRTGAHSGPAGAATP